MDQWSVVVKREWFYSVHKNIGLFVPAIPKHLRMSACLEEQMERGYESMYYRVPDNPALYNCKVCGKTVSNRWHHTRSHKPQNLKCPLCQQVFTRKDNMKTHLKWKHGSLSVWINWRREVYIWLILSNNILHYNCSFSQSEEMNDTTFPFTLQS